MEAGLWAITVAIISLIGSSWYQFANSKKDMKPLTGIQSTTSEMKPRVENIDYHTRGLSEKVLQEMYPDLKSVAKDVGESKSSISYIQKKFEVQEEMQRLYSQGLHKEEIVSGIESVYTENARLNTENVKLRESLEKENFRVKHLSQEVENLKEERDDLEEQLNKYYNRHDRDRGMSL